MLQEDWIVRIRIDAMRKKGSSHPFPPLSIALYRLTNGPGDFFRNEIAIWPFVTLSAGMAERSRNKLKQDGLATVYLPAH